MKHIRIYIMMLLALGFTACNEDFNQGVADPQSNPQEDPQVVEGFAISKDVDFNSPIVLGDLEEEAILAAVKAEATPEMAEGSSVTFRLFLSDTEDFANEVLLESTSADNAATVSIEALDAVITELFGKAPEARTAYLRAYIYILNGTSAVLVPNPVDLGTITVTPITPVVETAYYLIGTPNDWNDTNTSTLLKFGHSGKDVYEDAVFTLMVEISGDSYWKVVPQSNVDAVNNGEANSVWADGVLGTAEDGDTSLEGTLVERLGDYDPGAIKTEGTGWIKITLDLLERTYKVEIIGEMVRTLYAPGSYQNWTPATAATLFTQNVDFKYDGYAYFPNPDAEFKYTDAPDWEHGIYGTDRNGDPGNLIENGGDNITVATAGFYRLTANLSAIPYTYSATKTEWGIIGNATAGGWDNSTPMTLDPDTYEWTVTTTLTDGELKFRANNSWDINLGGNVNNLTYSSPDNIPIAEAGTYAITLKLGDPTAYTATIVKQ